MNMVNEYLQNPNVVYEIKKKNKKKKIRNFKNKFGARQRTYAVTKKRLNCKQLLNCVHISIKIRFSHSCFHEKFQNTLKIY